jgi:hypothetical protein
LAKKKAEEEALAKKKAEEEAAAAAVCVYLYVCLLCHVCPPAPHLSSPCALSLSLIHGPSHTHNITLPDVQY